jgi:hypothetical protein
MELPLSSTARSPDRGAARSRPGRIIFIVGAGRSGTTSALEALALSRQTYCLCEPMSNLNGESRDLMDGRLKDPYEPLVKHVVPRVAAGLTRGRVYVEKQLSLVPFMEHLAALLDCRFIITRRDGRAVVRSLIDWHNKMFPILYQECREQAELSEQAKGVLARQKAPDPFDYSLPRPHGDDPWHDQWAGWGRMEMLSWYWARINEMILQQIHRVGEDRCLVLDYTHPTSDDIRRAYEFAGLDDFDESAVRALLESRVNSLPTRSGQSNSTPPFEQWPADRQQRFWDIALDTMRACGYVDRRPMPTPGPTPTNENIESAGDMEAWLTAAARSQPSLRLMWRGFQPGLRTSRYQFDAASGRHCNTPSARHVEALLRREGFESVAAYPRRLADGELETVVAASRGLVDTDELVGGDEPVYHYAPYRVSPSGIPAAQIIAGVNISCGQYSEPPMRLTNDLAYFRAMMQSLRGIPGVRCGTGRDLAFRRDGVNVSVRVDLDIDLPAALEMALISSQVGVPLSFYLLHTAPYYGRFRDGVFWRHEAMADMYRALQDSGCEIGLHVDAFAPCLSYGVDGVEALRQELAWLRRLGLRIEGTSGHNAAPSYGAESCEVFAERRVGRGRHVLRDGCVVPVGALSEKTLGLTYEACELTPAPAGDERRLRQYLAGYPAGDFLRNRRWFGTYILDNPHCRWGHTWRAWLLGKDCWAIADRLADGRRTAEGGCATLSDAPGGEVFLFNRPWRDVQAMLAGLTAGQTCQLCVHPVYVGLRAARGAWPIGSVSAFSRR